MKGFSKRFWVFVIPVGLSLTLSGCVAEVDRSPFRPESFPISDDALRIETRGKLGGTFHYPLAGEPATSNPLAVQETRSRLATFLTTGTLLEFDPIEQRVSGGIAKEWKLSDDGLTMTLSLRRGVNFSDGKPLSVEDVLFTFQEIYQENSRNTLKDVLLVDGQPLRVSSIHSHHLEIQFPEPYAAAEYILTTIPVFPRHRFQEVGKKIEEYWTLETPPDQMAGLGPFVLSSHEPGQKSVFRYNPHYWKIDQKGTRLPYLDEVVLHYIADRNNQLLRFQACELDLLDQLLRPEDFLNLERRGDDQIVLDNAGPSSNLLIYWFNLNTGEDPATGKSYLSPQGRDWFTQMEFRQAVSTAISRDTIVKNVYLGQARLAWTLIPSSIRTWHADDVPQYEYNPARARELLRGAGFSWKTEGLNEILMDWKDRPVQFEILTRSDDVLQKIAAVIQQDLENIGMQVRIKQEEFRTVISRIMGSHDYDSALMSLDFPIDPVDHMNVLLSSAPMHMWYPNQPHPATEWEKRTDELMLQQRASLNTRERQKLYRDVQHILAQQVPIIPLVNKDILIANKSRLKNVRPANFFPFGLCNIWELYLETDP